jgi:hypothetical protein
MSRSSPSRLILFDQDHWECGLTGWPFGGCLSADH